MSRLLILQKYNFPFHKPPCSSSPTLPYSADFGSFVLEFLQKQAIASFPCKVRMFVERNACICPLAPIDLKAEIEKDGYDETNH